MLLLSLPPPPPTPTPMFSSSSSHHSPLSANKIQFSGRHSSITLPQHPNIQHHTKLFPDTTTTHSDHSCCCCASPRPRLTSLHSSVYVSPFMSLLIPRVKYESALSHLVVVIRQIFILDIHKETPQPQLTIEVGEALIQKHLTFIIFHFFLRQRMQLKS